MANRATQTAFGVMFEVALEQFLPAPQRIVDDKLARRMLPTTMQFMVSIMSPGPLRNWLFNLLEKQSPGIRNTILSRKRYIDDKLIEALGSGVDAVVILGAGLDTRAYRIPQLSAIKVYEVDLPENIDYKKKRLSRYSAASHRMSSWCQLTLKPRIWKPS